MNRKPRIGDSLPAPLTLCAPNPVGYYLVGRSLRLESSKEPRWLTKWLLRVLIEWEWVGYAKRSER